MYVENQNTGREEEINEQENNYRSKMSISANLMREYYNTKEVIRTKPKKYPEYSEITNLEDLMNSCILWAEKNIKCKEPEEWIKKNMIWSPINHYRECRKLYILKGQNPKIYDDQLAEITNELNEIPIKNVMPY